MSIDMKFKTGDPGLLYCSYQVPERAIMGFVYCTRVDNRFFCLIFSGEEGIDIFFIV